MKYFTIFDNIDYGNKINFYKIISCSTFVNQKWFPNISIFSKTKDIENLKNYLIANKDIKINYLDKINYNFPNNYDTSKKMIACSLHETPFCFISPKLFLWKNILENYRDNDFVFFSIDKSINNKYYNFYNIGFKFLEDIQLKIKEFENLNIKNINFNIYDTSLIMCNNINIYKKYFISLQNIFTNSDLINQKINSLDNKNKLIYSNALDKIFNNLLLSKIIHDNNCKISYISSDYKKCYFPNSNKIDISLFKNKSNLSSNINLIENFYNQIINTGYTSINNYILNFTKNNNYIEKMSWGLSIKEKLENEINTGGGCSSCKLKRLSSKYMEIVKGKFYE